VREANIFVIENDPTTEDATSYCSPRTLPVSNEIVLGISLRSGPVSICFC